MGVAALGCTEDEGGSVTDEGWRDGEAGLDDL